MGECDKLIAQHWFSQEEEGISSAYARVRRLYRQSTLKMHQEEETPTGNLDPAWSKSKKSLAMKRAMMLETPFLFQSEKQGTDGSNLITLYFASIS